MIYGIIFLAHFILGFITHYLMYLKYRLALGYKIKYNIVAYYDMLHKESSDPISKNFHGIVVIANGSLSFIIYIISQMYWTAYKSLHFLYDKYVLKQSHVKWKHYCLRSVISYSASLNHKYSDVVKREIRQDIILQHVMHSYESHIDWSKIIQFDSNDNIYFRGVICTKDELYSNIKALIIRYNSYVPIDSFEDL